ncbi:hypothetical protein ACJX0J_024632, partial [Zea mays]
LLDIALISAGTTAVYGSLRKAQNTALDQTLSYVFLKEISCDHRNMIKDHMLIIIIRVQVVLVFISTSFICSSQNMFAFFVVL